MKTIRRKKKNVQDYRRNVERVLQEVRNKYGIPGKFTPKDFYRICEAENIRLFEGGDARKAHKETPGLLGLLVRTTDGSRFIYLRSIFNRSRRISMDTAMHELGHYFLKHKGFTPKMLLAGKYHNNQNEKEADYFARLANQITKL